MKVLLILLFPMLVLGQSNPDVKFTAEEVNVLYQAVMEGEFCKEDYAACQEVAAALHAQLKSLALEMVTALAKLKSLNSDIAVLQDEKTRLSVDLEAEQSKPKNSILAAGPTAVLTPDLKVYGGIGVTLDLLSLFR